MQNPLLQIKTAPKTHIAIMRKSWGLTEKILSGEKTIESRWYENKCEPWDNIAEDDTVYFKDAGEPVALKSDVENVIQYENLTPKKVREILSEYGKGDGISENEIEKYYKRFMNKNYCILIFLKNVQKIAPFRINKAGFGMMSAWLVVPDIEKIKLPLKTKVIQKRIFR